MSLETATYIYNLVATNPTSTDPKSEGDDHIRVIKSVIKNSFAGFPGMVVVTGTEAQGATVNDYTVTITPAPSAYTASTLIVFKAAHANTGAVTLQINALGTKTLLAVDNTALKSGDIESGGVVFAYYDGTSFYLVSGNDRANRNGETYSGAHNFTSATPTVPTKAQGDNSTNAASTAYVDASTAAEAATRLAVDATKANILSPALTGTPTAPTAAAGTNTTQIATTAYVDASTAAEATARTAADATKANISSPALTGTPTAPTAAAGTNSTQIATTAYVDASMAAEAATRIAADATKANILSPALTGTPTAPTAAAGTSTTQLATCAFVTATAFSSIIPGQSGNAGKFVTTNGLSAYWTDVPKPDLLSMSLGVI